MAAKLTTIHPPKHSNWPTTGLVQIGPPTGDFRILQEILLDGEPIGNLITIKEHTPSRNIPGTRLRQDLKTRKAWKYSLSPGRDSRITYSTRGDAVGDALRDHFAKHGG